MADLADMANLSEGAGMPAVEDVNEPFDRELADSKLREDVEARLCDLYSTYRDHRQNYVEPIWNESYAAYHGIPLADNSPYGSHYEIREIFRQVEALKPMLSEILLPKKLFRYRAARAEKGFEEMADSATRLVHHQIERFDLRPELQRWLDSAPVWGISYLTFGWKQYKRIMHKIARLSVKNYDHGKPWDRKTEEVMEEGPFLRWLDHWSVYTDWRADRMEEAPVTYVYDRVTLEYIKTLVREGELDARAVEKAVEAAPRDGEHNWAPDRVRSRENDREMAGPNKDGLYPLVTAYTNDGWVSTLLNDKLVRCQRNRLGWLPILELRDYVEPGMHYGLGEPYNLLWDQALLNDAASMWVDSVHFGLNNMHVARKSEEKNINLLAYQPGAILYVDSDPKDAIVPLPVQNMSFNLDGVMNTLRTNMQLTSAMTDAALGESKHRTATGIVRLQDAASKRMVHKVTWMMPQFRKLYARLYEMNARFLDDEVALRVDGENAENITKRHGPESFAAEVDVEIELAPEQVNPEAERMKWVQLWQMVAADPRFRSDKIQLQLLRAFDVPNPKDSIASPEYGQRDAMQESREWAASGLIQEPRPHEDHATHIQVHQMFMQTPEFQVAPPQWQQAYMNHMTWHAQMLQQIMGQQQQAAMTSTAMMGAGSPVPGSDARTETTFGNAQRGAAQQGVMPGA